MKAIYVEPDKEARFIDVENKLETLQKMVGGYIEVAYPYEDYVGIICNEEGKINGMELNRAIRDTESEKIIDIIAGPFLVVGLGEEDFTDLSEDYSKKYLAMFKHPEVFIKAEDQIIAIKVPIPKEKGGREDR